MCQESSVDVKIPFFYYFCIVKVNGFFLFDKIDSPGLRRVSALQDTLQFLF